MQARDAYLAYRQQGGYAQYGGGKILEVVLDMMAEQSMEEIAQEVDQLAHDPDTARFAEAFAAGRHHHPERRPRPGPGR